jgi:3-hydroxybutyryl-CoA dehydratase
MNYDELIVGDVYTFRKTISETDVYLFAGITADMNPLHIDQEFASGTPFSSRVAHGVIGVGIISGLLARTYPGGVLLGQSIKYLSPVYIGDTITAKIEIIKKDDKRRTVTFKTWCENSKGTIVMEGDALGMARKDDVSGRTA